MFHKEIIFLSIMILLFPNVYAQQTIDQACGSTQADCYQETGFRLTSNPVICVGNAADPTLTNKMHGFTTAATAEWRNLLNTGSNARNPLWDIQLMPTQTDVCNIKIDYLAQPSLSEEKTVGNDTIGVTFWNFTSHTAEIHIYYNDLKFEPHLYLCYGVNDTACVPTTSEACATCGDYFDNYTSYFSNSPAPDYKMEWIIKHELGHALGLGHYIMTNEEGMKWMGGGLASPSIMIPFVLDPSIDGDAGIFQSPISSMDVNHLKSLYGNDGFNSPIFPLNDTSNLQPQTMPPIQNSSAPANVTMSKIPSWVKNNAGWWSQGLVGNDDFIKGIQYLIQQGIIQIPSIQSNSNLSQTIPSWVKNNAGWWANGQVSDDEFIKGIQYLVSNGIIKLS